jgi:predicted membrane protein
LVLADACRRIYCCLVALPGYPSCRGFLTFQLASRSTCSLFKSPSSVSLTPVILCIIHKQVKYLIMKQLLAVVLILTIASNGIQAQTNDEKAVAAAVETLRKVMIDPDKTVLEQLTVPELSYGHSTGKVQDQAAFVDALVSGSSDFVTIDLSEQTIKVTGNTAVVRHVLNATNNDGGKPGTVKIAVLLVWIKQNKEWKLLARQAVKI